MKNLRVIAILLLITGLSLTGLGHKVAVVQAGIQEGQFMLAQVVSQPNLTGIDKDKNEDKNKSKDTDKDKDKDKDKKKDPPSPSE